MVTSFASSPAIHSTRIALVQKVFYKYPKSINNPLNEALDEKRNDSATRNIGNNPLIYDGYLGGRVLEVGLDPPRVCTWVLERRLRIRSLGGVI
jgi:hypothetical protein